MVFVYQPSRACFSPDVLKAALSKALVPFYPLAGRLAEDRASRQEIRCTGDGVLFLAARIDATLDDMGGLVPSDELRRMLVPSADGERSGILLMLQVRCRLHQFCTGLFCFGILKRARVRARRRRSSGAARCASARPSTACLTGDGRAFANFLNTWAAIARGVDAAAMPRPCLDRTLLRARSPPAVRFDHAAVYSGRSGGGANPNVASEAAVLPVSRNQVDALKGSAGGARSKKVTTFSAVVAHVWRCACMARGLEGTEDTRLYMTSDARSRVRPPLPDGYLGNAVVRASAVAKVDAIISGSLGAAAKRVSDATARLNDEFVRSLVDHVELATSDAEAAAGLRIAEWKVIPETDLWVVSWLGMAFSDVDFGWGRPAFVRQATIKGGAVFLVPSPDGRGGLDGRRGHGARETRQVQGAVLRGPPASLFRVTAHACGQSFQDLTVSVCFVEL
ncbi:hypothetical protein EJB05_45930, partial [Eragrostis curvula]